MNRGSIKRGISPIEIIIIGAIFVALVLGMIPLVANLFLQEEFLGRVNNCKSLEVPLMTESSQVFSYSVEVETDDEIINFSSEDRQFATIQKDDVIKVKVFKYPPWNIKKSGTYYDGRLLKKYKK